MKKSIFINSLIIFILGAIIAALCILCPVGGNTAKADSDDSPAYAYGNSSVVFDVDENKVLHVKENLRIGFEREVRSITRRIPAQTSSYKNFNGGMIKWGSFLSKISNVKAVFKRADGETFQTAKTDFNKNGTNYYLSVENTEGYFDLWEKGDDGRQYDFQLEYDFDQSDDTVGASTLAFNFFDENPRWFYYGDDKTNIARLNVTINMPKPFDGGRAKVFFGNDNINESSGLTQNGNSLNFSVPFKAIGETTVRIGLDNNYFNTQVTYYPYYWCFAAMVAIIILACIIMTVIYRGRKPVCPVEIAPPVVNPLHYSAYWHGYPQRKDVTTIILYWARLGSIRITKDGKKDLILTKLKPLPDECTGAEKRYFAELFRYGDTFRSKDTRGWKNIGRKDRLRFEVNSLVEESEKPTPFVPQVERTKMFVNVLSVIAIAVMYTYFAVLSGDIISLLVLPLFLGITLIPIVKLNSVFGGMHDLKQRDLPRFYGISFMMLCLLIPIGLFAGFMFFVQYMPPYDYIHMTVISFVWLIISFFVLPLFIKKRTEEANALYGRMLGFKRFISLADLPRMELLLKDNPDYFYDVLPYCMVMGLSKKIDKQMQYLGVAVPDWADGFNPATFAEELFYSVKHAIIVRRKKAKRNMYALDE